MKNGKSSFLEAKILKPLVSPEFVLRESLIERLRDGGQKLVLLQAAMGYGKTVLLTQYAQNPDEDCVWYHLSEIDNDSVLFMQYLSASIKKNITTFDFDFQVYAPLLQEDAALETMLYDFIGCVNRAAPPSGRKLVLILDDFQIITNEDICRIIRMLLDHTGDTLRIMIATKGAVPSFCFRYMLECTTDVITRQELAFSRDEVRALLRGFWRDGEYDSLSETIWEKAEGWPAGVMFAYIYLKQQRQGPSSAESALTSQKPAMDAYFMHELFKKLPYDIQTFLVKTSPLEFLSAELCNAVLHVQDAHSVLDYLERENLFINKVGQPQRLFRYHSLFKDFLRTMLNREAEEEIMTKAAEFYLSTPDKALAVEYAMSGRNWDLMQYALESVGQELLEQGKLNTLERWIVEMEINRIPVTPKNKLWMGSYYYRTGQTPKAMVYLDQAMQSFLSSMDETGYICCMLEKARVARNQASLEESCRLIEEILPRLDRRYHRLWHSVVMERLYNFVLLGRYREALAICSEMILNLRKAGDQKAEGLFMRFSTIVYFYMGNYRKSIKLYRDLLEFHWITGDEDDLVSVEAYLALMYLFTGQQEDALKTIQDELERSLRTHQREDVWLVHLIRSFICLTLSLREDGGELRQAYLLREAENSIDMAQRHVSYFRQNLSYVKSVQLLDELIRYRTEVRPGPKALVSLAARVFQAERKAITLVREMALSTLGEWLAEAGETTLAGEAARRCLADIVWEDAFSFSARTTWARAGQAEGKAEEVAAQHNLLESYDREQQFDWSCLPKGQRDYVENLFRQKEAVDRDGKIRVECFGPFRVLLPDAAEEVRWRTKKAQELFAYLFHLQGQAVNKETILLHLWPDTDKESATSLLHTSLYSIRKMLALQRLEDVIVYDKKKYAMNMEMVQSTLDKMNPLCRALEQHDEAFVYNCREILYACCGEYLGGVTNEYAVAPRAYYEQKFLQLSETAARKSMEKQEWAEAVSLLDMAIGVDPFEESLYQLILQCFRSMKDVKRARRYYTRLKDILRDELDVDPSPEVTAAYRYCLESGTGLRDMAAV